MKKYYYVCVEFTKDCMRKYFYQYCNNKIEADKLLTAVRKQNKSLIGWVDFVWHNNFISLSESVLHGKMFTKTELLLQEITT